MRSPRFAAAVALALSCLLVSACGGTPGGQVALDRLTTAQDEADALAFCTDLLGDPTEVLNGVFGADGAATWEAGLSVPSTGGDSDYSITCDLLSVGGGAVAEVSISGNPDYRTDPSYPAGDATIFLGLDESVSDALFSADFSSKADDWMNQAADHVKPMPG